MWTTNQIITIITTLRIRIREIREIRVLWYWMGIVHGIRIV